MIRIRRIHADPQNWFLVYMFQVHGKRASFTGMRGKKASFTGMRGKKADNSMEIQDIADPVGCRLCV